MTETTEEKTFHIDGKHLAKVLLDESVRKNLEELAAHRQNEEAILLVRQHLYKPDYLASDVEVSDREDTTFGSIPGLSLIGNDDAPDPGYNLFAFHTHYNPEKPVANTMLPSDADLYTLSRRTRDNEGNYARLISGIIVPGKTINMFLMQERDEHPGFDDLEDLQEFWEDNIGPILRTRGHKPEEVPGMLGQLGYYNALFLQYDRISPEALAKKLDLFSFIPVKGPAEEDDDSFEFDPESDF